MDRGVRAAAVLAAFGLALLTATEADGRTYKRGEVISISGRVTGADGQPLANVSVVLEVSRHRFKLGRIFQRGKPSAKSDTLRIPTAAGQDGSYSFNWRWDPFYDTFELAVALPVRQGGQESFEVFHRKDATALIRQGNPVAVALVIEDGAFLSWLRRFFSDLASDDERRVFDQLGLPDRIDELERSGGTEVSWWYFEAGKVYRFRGGTLAEVEDFEPVAPAPQ